MMLQNGCLLTGKALSLSYAASWNMTPKPKGHGSTLEETWPNYLIYSAVTSTKLPLCCIILKRRWWRKTTNRRNEVF